MDMHINPHVRFPTALFHSATTMIDLGKHDRSMQERSESSSKERIRDLSRLMSLLYWLPVTSLVTTDTPVTTMEEVDLNTCHAPQCHARALGNILVKLRTDGFIQCPLRKLVNHEMTVLDH